MKYSVLLQVSSEDNFELYLYNKLANGTILTKDNLYLMNLVLKTVFVIHGWKKSPQDQYIVELAQEHAKKGDHNAITVGWTDIASKPYASAVKNSKKVG